MKKLSVKDFVSGMKLETDVYNKNGAIILPKETELTPKHIELLQSWGIVYAKEKVKKDKNFFMDQKELRKKFSASKDLISNFMKKIKYSDDLEIGKIENITEELLTYTLSTRNHASLINEMKSKDSYTFQHSMNVAVYSSLIGKWLNYDLDTIKELSMAALLHDIGKMKVPETILNKPTKLSDEEFEQIKKHPEYGYEIIFNTKGLGKNIAFAILQHHERTDGSGYPLGLKEDKITDFAKIIAVADTFDAMTSERSYDQRYSPFDALNEIKAGAFKNLDPKISLLFIDNILSFFVGSNVVLNTGEKGEIVYFYKEDLHNPVIRTDHEIIDLSKEDNKELADVLIF
ncbi:HD-GYP domain-containing protein [Natranaerofaba carboxydovora]|uniref:HD-GYP domain-containing protein n=1 Tax=Natranaerofaba carboxydovora TaxID=2742683 RepID=UPI001F13FD7E|nr:HD-GYP domain-containing protein [Natranaerofaba carboxydovora]UMZ72503.1 Cyclic di-GMP phosphodiesterase response regulator RpfG [Natranaerofaba carboxydovora]